MKKIIAVVIIGALILATFTILQTPSVRAQTSQAQVLSYSWYIAPTGSTLAQYSGDLIAVGEIQNVGSNVLSNVGISGFAYNSSGQALDSASFVAYGNNLLPGEKAPFYLDFLPYYSVTPQDSSWIQTVTNITIVVTNLNATTTIPYSGVSIAPGSTGTDSSGTYTVTGTIQNNGHETTGNVWVVSTFYNTNGTVIALGLTNYLSSSFASGDSAAFAATPMDNTATLSSEIANYSLLVQFDPLGASATPTPLPASSSPTPISSSPASTHPTQGPGTMSLSLIYPVTGAIVAVVVVLMALMLLSKRHKNPKLEIPPPPPPPP